MSPISITAHTPHGIFIGSISAKTSKESNSIIEVIRENISTLDYLQFDTWDNKTILMGSKMIKESIFIFEVSGGVAQKQQG